MKKFKAVNLGVIMLLSMAISGCSMQKLRWKKGELE
jgi:hypothetical protein